MDSHNEPAKNVSYFGISGTLLRAAYDWSSVPENFPYALGVLLLNFILYQSELVPRWLSVWGLIGGTLLLVMGFLRMFSLSVEYLALPIVLNELVLSVWLLVVGIDSHATASVVVGALFLVALAATILSGTFTKSKDGPDYLTAVAANQDRMLIGVLFQLALTASVVAIPIVMFPILKQHSETLALGYVGARIFEGFFDAMMAISLLLLLTLSREFVEAGSPAVETVTTGAE